MKSLNKLVEHIDEHEALLLARDVDIEHRELMALAAKEVKRYSIDPLVEENAKLRELCAVMRAKTPVLCRVGGCRDSCPNTALCEREAELVSELGIEVEDDD